MENLHAIAAQRAEASHWQSQRFAHIEAAYTRAHQADERLRKFRAFLIHVTHLDLSDTAKLQEIYLRLHELVLELEKTKNIVAGAQAFAALAEKLTREVRP